LFGQELNATGGAGDGSTVNAAGGGNILTVDPADDLEKVDLFCSVLNRLK